MKKSDKTNVEIDIDETADFRSQINDMSEENDAKYVLSEDSPQSLAQQKTETLESAIPKWPVYNQPVAQYDALKSEFTQVKSQQKHWQSLLKEHTSA